jgi:hypothetical protein
MMNGESDMQEARLLAVLKEARDEAYARGWQDAVRSIVTAATNAAPNSPRIGEAMAPEVQPTIHRDRPLKTAGRAPYGSCIRAIAASFKEAGDSGIDLDLVRETGLRTEGARLAESSIRSTLIDMVREGEAERRNGRWFLTRSSETETAGHAQEAHPAAPILNHQGGSHETALASSG